MGFFSTDKLVPLKAYLIPLTCRVEDIQILTGQTKMSIVLQVQTTRLPRTTDTSRRKLSHFSWRSSIIYRLQCSPTPKWRGELVLKTHAVRRLLGSILRRHFKKLEHLKECHWQTVFFMAWMWCPAVESIDERYQLTDVLWKPGTKNQYNHAQQG